MGEQKSLDFKFGLFMFAAIAVGLLLSSAVSFVNGANTTQVSSSAEVGETISVTINSTTITWTGLTAGTSNNVSATTGGNPLNVTIHAETNVATNVSVNGSNLITGGNTLAVGNLTYANASTAIKSELGAAFASGYVGALGDKPYANFVNIADPATDAQVDILWFVSVPVGQPQGTYAGTLYVKIANAV